MGTSRKKASKKANTARRSTVSKYPADVAVMAIGRQIPFGFPHQLLTKIRYHDTIALNSVAGSTAKYVFRSNSTFDPDLTGVGHQPLYRDIFASIYDQYAVVATDFVIKAVNNTANTWLVGCVQEDDNSSSSTVSVLCEQTKGQHTLLPPQTGSLSAVTFNQHFDCKKQLGIDPYMSETYKTGVAANPTEEADLLIWGADLTSGTTSIFVDVEIVMMVLWTELTSPISS